MCMPCSHSQPLTGWNNSSEQFRGKKKNMQRPRVQRHANDKSMFEKKRKSVSGEWIGNGITEVRPFQKLVSLYKRRQTPRTYLLFFSCLRCISPILSHFIIIQYNLFQTAIKSADHLMICHTQVPTVLVCSSAHTVLLYLNIQCSSGVVYCGLLDKSNIILYLF